MSPFDIWVLPWVAVDLPSRMLMVVGAMTGIRLRRRNVNFSASDGSRKCGLTDSCMIHVPVLSFSTA